MVSIFLYNLFIEWKKYIYNDRRSDVIHCIDNLLNVYFYIQQIEKPFSVWTYQDVIDFLAEQPVRTIF